MLDKGRETQSLSTKEMMPLRYVSGLPMDFLMITIENLSEIEDTLNALKRRLEFIREKTSIGANVIEKWWYVFAAIGMGLAVQALPN
ncbi:unnamed protein product [Medioppia subpectinata]|uniref:Uncharacterized protein n=1 Tax=Medioppia subpectinata TaxID=1979941 RepID=A0A7R9KRA0_9ACAR|nr:unnamed protein product [Medioppia subpectinata]CAG2108334.1 unnamed protein product [Medioppia subpectinata]